MTALLTLPLIVVGVMLTSRRWVGYRRSDARSIAAHRSTLGVIEHVAGADEAVGHDGHGGAHVRLLGAPAAAGPSGPEERASGPVEDASGPGEDASGPVEDADGSGWPEDPFRTPSGPVGRRTRPGRPSFPLAREARATGTTADLDVAPARAVMNSETARLLRERVEVSRRDARRRGIDPSAPVIAGTGGAEGVPDAPEGAGPMSRPRWLGGDGRPRAFGLLGGAGRRPTFRQPTRPRLGLGLGSRGDEGPRRGGAGRSPGRADRGRRRSPRLPGPRGSRRARVLGAAAAVLLVGGVAAAFVAAGSGHPGGSPGRVAGAPTSGGTRSAPSSSTTTTAPPTLTATSISAQDASYVASSVPLDVEFSASGPCWVELRTGSQSGPVLYEGTLSAGATQRFTSPSDIWMRVGHPASLQLQIDRSQVDMPSGGSPFNIVVTGPTGA